MIFKPELPQVDGYIEVESKFGRVYKSLENEILYYPNLTIIGQSVPNYIEFCKKNKIEDSKKQLEIYLLNNPIQWTDGLYYSITQEKQNQLTSKILSATLAKTMSQPYNLTWNSTGEICKTWELEELSALAFAIDERVTKLVTYQQTQEVAIRNCNSQEELNLIVIDYDSVK